MSEWIGYLWLAEEFRIKPAQPLLRSSRIGRPRSSVIEDGVAVETYVESIPPDASLAAHLAFALKNEGVHLEFLARLFADLPVEVMAAWIAREPTGQYARRAGFLFKWLTGRVIPFARVTQGNYVLALAGARQPARHAPLLPFGS
jgi:hypothetical protein